MASKNVHELNELNFQSLVLEAQSPVLVDFTARWCPPCRALSPVVERIAERFPNVVVGSLDVDEHPALASRYGVCAMPTLVVFDFGQESARHVGFAKEPEVARLLGEQ